MSNRSWTRGRGKAGAAFRIAGLVIGTVAAAGVAVAAAVWGLNRFAPQLMARAAAGAVGALPGSRALTAADKAVAAILQPVPRPALQTANALQSLMQSGDRAVASGISSIQQALARLPIRLG